MQVLPRSFMGRLIVLSLLALAPFFILEFLYLNRIRADLIVEHRDQASTMARAVALQHRSLMKAAELALGQISLMSRIRHGAPSVCADRVAEILRASPLLGTIVRGTPDGAVDCSDNPERTSFSKAAMTAVRRAILSGGVASGPATIGTRSQKPIVPIAIPLAESPGDADRVLVASVSLDWLDRLVADLAIGSEAVVLVLDDRAAVLAAHPQAPALVGRTLAGLKERPEGDEHFENILLPDRLRRTMSVTGFENGIRVAVGIDHRRILAGIERQQIRHFAIFAAVALVSLLLFGFLARLAFQRRHNRFQEAAQRMAEGDLTSRMTVHPGDSQEFQRFALVFNTMAEAIALRDGALLRQSQLLAEAENVAGMGSWIWNAGQKEHVWSDGLWRILGRPPGSMASSWENWLCCIHPEDTARVAAEAGAITLGRVYEYNYRIMHPDGRVRFVQARGVCRTDPEGKILGTVGVVIDITERKADQDRLRMLSLAVEQAQDTVIIANSLGRIEYVNPAFERITGFEAKEAIGSFPTLLRTPQTPAGTYRRIHADLIEGKSWTEELHTRRKDDSPIWMESAFHPIRDADGQVTHFVSLHRDIAARKEAERILRAATQRAQAGQRAMSEFLAHMSHELRTPLNAIIGYSEAMLSGVLGAIANARHREYTRDIFDSGHHLLALINDILDISAVEAGMLSLAPETVALDAITESCLRLVQPRALKGRVRLAVEMPKPAPSLIADPRRLKQILINLLSNAVKFSPPKSDVTLAIALNAEGGCCLAVTDRGIGMDAEGIAKALVPFGRVEGTEYHYEGTGLGLPLTKSLIELHGGIIAIESAKGQGTTATVCFPPERVSAPKSN